MASDPELYIHFEVEYRKTAYFKDKVTISH